MSRISVDVSSARTPVLQVGYQGENEVTDVLFDISSWITEFGEGVAQLRVKRPGNSEEESYVLSLTITDGIAVWTVSDTDTFNKGNGKVQLSYMVGNILKKAVIYPYKVGKSIVGADNPVDPFDSWIERSKAWAIGETLDGDYVPETDETYQNNAKYYAEQADILGSAQVVLATEQATLATEKAGAAAESESNAAASEAAVNGVSTQLTTRMSAIETEQSVQSARMDTFTSLPEGSTSGNAELADIRVGADGTTYDTAGNAVRGQISGLKSDLDKCNYDIQDIISNNKEKVNENPFVIDNKTENGVTISKNDDGTYTLTGTATQDFDFLISDIIYGLGDKTYTYYGQHEGMSLYMYEYGVGSIKINDTLNYFIDGKTITIPNKSNCTLTTWITKGKTYDVTFSFELYEGDVSRHKNDIVDFNNKLDKHFCDVDESIKYIKKSLSCESLINEADNLLTDSVFNNSLSGLTKNGIEFNFNDAVIGTGIYNIFNEFTLAKGEYSLLIGSEKKLSNDLNFALQNQDGSTNIIINLKSGTNSSVKHFNLENDVTLSNCGFYGYTTSYNLTGKIRLALVKGNVDGFSYKINDEIESLKSEINMSENEIIFYDDFNNPYLNKNVWCMEIGTTRNRDVEEEYYREENVSLENGCLKITAKKEEFNGKQWTSGAVQSIKGLQFGLNTKITAKIKLENCGDGAWPAFWSYGGQLNYKRQEWPANGEIDIFELWKSGGSGYATTTLHNETGSVYSDINLKYFDENWHIWSMEWIENSISVYCDDELVYTFNTSELLDSYGYSCFNDKGVNQRLVFNIAIDKNKLSDNAPNEMYMYVDYVKVESIGFKKSSYLQFESNNITCNVGDEIVLVALPDVECSDKTVLWKVEDETVIEHKYKQFDYISYGYYGTFIALKSGNTSVTVKDKYGNSDTCTITVN